MTALRGKAHVSFRVREKLKKGRAPLSERELQWNRRIGQHETDKYALLPTGCLKFEVGTRFIDEGDGSRFEGDRISELVNAVMTQLDYEDVHIKEKEERDRRLAILAEHRRLAYEARLEEEKRAQAEEERWQRFVRMSTEWHTVRRVECFLDAVTASGDGGLPAEQVEWLKTQIQKRNPLGTERILSEELACERCGGGEKL